MTVSTFDASLAAGNLANTHGSTFSSGRSGMRPFTVRALLLVSLLLATKLALAGDPTLPRAMRSLLDTIGFNLVLTEARATPRGDAVVTIVHADPMSSRAGTQIVWVEIKRTQLSMEVVPVLKFGGSYDLYESSTPADFSAAINGGFFGYDTKGHYIPLGLVVSKADLRNRKAPWKTGGVLYQDKLNQLQIKPIRFGAHAHVYSAIQSKPLLVEEGHVAIRSDDGERFNRSAVAITKAGEVILIGAFNSFGRAMAMKEFAQTVAAIRSSSGSAIQISLGMDGGPGAQLYIPALKLNFGDPGKNFVPNIVMFRARD